jgi:ABC-2 type transport system ATP-binding protein
VEHISDRVGIIRNGRLVRLARLADLHEIRFHQVEIQFAGTVPVEAITRAAGVDRVEVKDSRLRCIVRGSFEPLMQALRDGHVINFASHEPSLEEVFLTFYRGDGELKADEIGPTAVDA